MYRSRLCCCYRRRRPSLFLNRQRALLCFGFILLCISISLCLSPLLLSLLSSSVILCRVVSVVEGAERPHVDHHNHERTISTTTRSSVEKEAGKPDLLVLQLVYCLVLFSFSHLHHHFALRRRYYSNSRWSHHLLDGNPWKVKEALPPNPPQLRGRTTLGRTYQQDANEDNFSSKSPKDTKSILLNSTVPILHCAVLYVSVPSWCCAPKSIAPIHILCKLPLNPSILPTVLLPVQYHPTPQKKIAGAP